MAIETNIFKSGATSADYVNPELWSDAIEQVARESEKMRPLGVMDNRALGTSGKQINIAKNQQYSAAALTEGTKTPVSTIAWDQVTVNFVEYGLAKQVSDLELAYGISTMFNDITLNMGSALGENRDNVIIAALSAGAGSTIYANGKATGTITTGDVFDTDLFADGKTAMRVDKREARYLIIHPNQENALLKDAQFVDASVYGGRETVLGGEIGRYLGVKVISHTGIISGTENSVTVYRALLLGPRSFVFAQKIAPKVAWKEDSILDRAITFSAKETFGVSVLNDEAIVELRSL